MWSSGYSSSCGWASNVRFYIYEESEAHTLVLLLSFASGYKTTISRLIGYPKASNQILLCAYFKTYCPRARSNISLTLTYTQVAKKNPVVWKLGLKQKFKTLIWKTLFLRVNRERDVLFVRNNQLHTQPIYEKEDSQ